MALGDTLLSEGKLDKAEQVFRQSLAFSNEMSRKTDTADAWFGLARIARMRGDVKRAAEMAQTALYLFERYRSRAEVDQVATFIIGLEKPKPLFPAWLIRKGR